MDDEEVRKLGHALRNILAPAMMMAERLADHADPAVQRASTIILKSLDAATAALRSATQGRDQ